MPLSTDFVLSKFKKVKCVAICGVATAGKDTFYALLEEYLKQHGISTKRVALADKLKDEIDPYLVSQFGISAWTKNPTEKKLIRPSLVAHGFVRRQQTAGTYWTKQLEGPIESLIGSDIVPIITDIRYAEFQDDEIYWVRKFGGKLVYITRFYTDMKSGEKNFVQPPNEDERRNDPRLREQADHLVEWDTVAVPTLANLGFYVEEFIKKI